MTQNAETVTESETTTEYTASQISAKNSRVRFRIDTAQYKLDPNSKYTVESVEDLLKDVWNFYEETFKEMAMGETAGPRAVRLLEDYREPLRFLSRMQSHARREGMSAKQAYWGLERVKVGVKDLLNNNPNVPRIRHENWDPHTDGYELVTSKDWVVIEEECLEELE